MCVCICVCVCVCIRWRGQGRGARLPRKWMCWPHQRAPSWCGFGSSSWQAHGQGGVCICAALALSWRGLGRFGASSPPHTSGFKGDPPTATTQSHWSLHWEQKSIELSTAALSGVSVPLLSSFAFLRMYHQHTFSFLLSLPHPYFLCPHFLHLFLLYPVFFISRWSLCPTNSFS